MEKHIKAITNSGTFTRVTLPIILIILLGIIGFATFKEPGSKVGGKSLNQEQAQNVADSFINTYLMNPGTRANIVSISDEYNLYKLNVDIGDDVVESYLSKDGKLFFPQAFNIEEIEQEAGLFDEGGSAPVMQAPKSDKPTIELFVMSHCPYGTQIQKGILPVLYALEDKVNFKMKFVDYAMHGEIELKEQTLQHCLQEEQSDKYYEYLECFLVDGNTEQCLNDTGVNKTRLNTCIATTDATFKIMENFTNNIGYRGSYPGFDIHKEDNEKYGVGGSPTLIINGAEIQANRDPASLMNTICSAFNEAPEECLLPMPNLTPVPGFGMGTTSNNVAAACM